MEEVLLPPEETCAHSAGIYRINYGRPTAQIALEAMLKGGLVFVSGSLKLQRTSEKERMQTQSVFAAKQAEAKTLPVVQQHEVALPVPGFPPTTPPPPEPTYPLPPPPEEPTPPYTPPVVAQPAPPAAPPSAAAAPPTTPESTRPITEQLRELEALERQFATGTQNISAGPLDRFSLQGQHNVMTDWDKDNTAVVMFTVNFDGKTLQGIAAIIDKRIAALKTPPVECGAFTFASCVAKLVHVARRKIAQQAYTLMAAIQGAQPEKSTETVHFSGIADVDVTTITAFNVDATYGTTGDKESPMDPLRTWAMNPDYKLMTSGASFTIIARNICTPIHGGVCIYRSLILVLQDIDDKGVTTLLPMPNPGDTPSTESLRVCLEYGKAKKAKTATGTFMGKPMHDWSGVTICAECFQAEAMQKSGKGPKRPKDSRHTRAIDVAMARVVQSHTV